MSRDLEDVLREIGELSNIHADRKKLRANLRENQRYVRLITIKATKRSCRPNFQMPCLKFFYWN